MSMCQNKASLRIPSQRMGQALANDEEVIVALPSGAEQICRIVEVLQGGSACKVQSTITGATQIVTTQQLAALNPNLR